MGALRDIPPYDLAAIVLNEVVKRAKVEPSEVDDVIFGSCYMNGKNVNIGRMTLLAGC